MRKLSIFLLLLITNMPCSGIAQDITPEAKLVYPTVKGAKLPMIDVMNGCQEHHKFTDFRELVLCILGSYQLNGTAPDSPAVINFVALLLAITEDYVKGDISFVKARAQMVTAWMNTIDADNKANATAQKNIPQGQANRNPWADLNDSIRRLDPATNQKHVDQMCYSDCLGAGRSAGLCLSKCSY